MTNNDQAFQPNSVPQPNSSQPSSDTPSPTPYTQPYAQSAPYAQPAQQGSFPQGTEQHSYAQQSNTYGQFGSYQAQATTFNSGYGTVIPLRPLGIGDTLDATFRLIKFNPVAYFVFPLILFLALGIVEAVFSLGLGEIDVNDPFGSALHETTAMLGKDLFISFPLTIIVSGLIMIGTTRITLASVRGRKVSLKEAFEMIKPRGGILLLRLIAFDIIVSLVVSASMFIVAGIILLIAFASGIATTSSDSITSMTVNLLVLGILVFFLVLLIGAAYFAFYLRFALAPSAMVAEDIGPFKAIARSWNLTKGSFGYLLGTVLTVTLIASMVSTAIVMPLSIVTALFGGPTAIFLTSIGSSVALSIALTPIQGVLMNLLYVNMRFKRENLHLSLLAEHQA